MKLLQYIHVHVYLYRMIECVYIHVIIHVLQTINYRGTTECMRQTLLECVITTCML